MRYLTVRQVADSLQVCEETVRRWCREGLLPAKKIGKDWRIPETAIGTPKLQLINASGTTAIDAEE